MANAFVIVHFGTGAPQAFGVTGTPPEFIYAYEQTDILVM